MLNVAMQAARDNVEVVDVTTVKPLDYDYLNNIGNAAILTLEENVVKGGFGESVLTYLSQSGKGNKIQIMGVTDTFVRHATVDEQIEMCGLSVDSINKIVDELLK